MRFGVSSTLVFPAAFFFSTLLLAGASQAKNVKIWLDPAITYQRIENWEATVSLDSRPFEMPRTGTRDAEIIARTIDEIGINRLRFEIRSGTENTSRMISRLQRGEVPYKRWRAERYAVVNDNDDAQVINWAGFDFTELDWQIDNAVQPMRKIFASRGETLFLNLCYVAFTAQITDGEYLHDDAEEYGEFVLATYLHMQEKYGFVPDAWEVILEPDNVDQWKRDPRLIGRAIVAAARRLEAHGFTPSFIAPSVTDMKNAVPYFDALAAVPGALRYLRELSYHRYWGGNLQAIADRARQADVGTSMLEFWFGRATYEVLYEDLTTGNNIVWQGRLMHEQFDLEGAQEGVPLTLSEDVRYTRQYTAYIRAGAQRVGALSARPDIFAPLAFINPDGDYVVVIKAGRGGDIEVHDLPPGRYELSYAVEYGSETLPEPVLVTAGGFLAATVPAKGVFTVSALP